MPEPFVDVTTAAAYLAISTRRLLDLARAGDLPAHPLALGRKRREWRFRLSELEKCLADRNGSSSVLADSRSKSERSVVRGAGR